jgi:hypothetical protein
VQVLAPALGEATMIRVAGALEAAAPPVPVPALSVRTSGAAR